MAGSSFGGTVKLKGETEYQRSLRQITTNLTVLSSEMKVITSQYDKNDKSVGNLSQQNVVLNKKIDEQKSKIDTLTKALADSKKETGENSTTTKKWQTELNNATAELNKLEKNVSNNAKGMKEFGAATEEAGNDTSRLSDIIKGNLLSDAIQKGLSLLADTIKSIGSSFIDVGKQALNSYADYEQLVGGVDTLFKDNSGLVQEYANDAYKTAGLSANDYMETITSFSASLLQSLNGDTKKSAEVANMAITDMADNANKMGTDMSMIQSAYQGFAKQNYTMLDNLKLGYGGTKSEMERLLKDAQKISGVKYDISNLNDIYQAIHIIQGELGITGTTAKEASTTIQGSVASMKSAWKNLLVGVASENANFNQLVNNFIDSVAVSAENIFPRIAVIFDGMGLLITDLLNLLLERLLPMTLELITTLVNNISDSLPDILGSLSGAMEKIFGSISQILPQITSIAFQIINQLTSSLLENLPQIISCGVEIITSLINGLVESIPNLIPVIVNSVITITETLLDHLDEIIDAGIQIMFALVDGIINALPNLIDRIPEIIDKLVIVLVNNLPKIIQAGILLTVKLAEGLIKALPQLLSKIPQIISSIVSGFSNLTSSMHDIGRNLVAGIWNGLSNSLEWIKDKIRGWVGNVTKFIKRLFGINSPSKVFKEEIGTNLALGIGEGFSDTMKDVSTEMASSIPNSFDTNINTISSASSSNNSFEYSNLVFALKDALKDTKVIMNGREMGAFIIDTVASEVY